MLCELFRSEFEFLVSLIERLVKLEPGIDIVKSELVVGTPAAEPVTGQEVR